MTKKLMHLYDKRNELLSDMYYYGMSFTLRMRNNKGYLFTKFLYVLTKHRSNRVYKRIKRLEKRLY